MTIQVPRKRGQNKRGPSQNFGEGRVVVEILEKRDRGTIFRRQKGEKSGRQRPGKIGIGKKKESPEKKTSWLIKKMRIKKKPQN